MKINLRQEIAMWVLGLSWTAIGILSLKELLEEPVAAISIPLVLLVPIFLLIFSLRDREKSDLSHHE